jgi:hypothetical protein
MTKFTAENYKAGFLLDEELMAGISESTESPGLFTAYVVRHTTGETLGTQQFTDVFEALRIINDIPRQWTFESTSKCGGNCAAGGCGKKGGGCGKKKNASSAGDVAETASDCSTGSCPI